MATVGFLVLVDEIEADIRKGVLRPGYRLPPQRRFAFERGIAASTAGRVYAELLRRGLVVGEVGRGTFIAGRVSTQVSRGEPHDGRVDLEFNFPSVPEQAGLVARALAGLERAEVLGTVTGPITRARLEAAQNAAAQFLSSRDWQAFPQSIIFTNVGRQAIAGALAGLVAPGGRLAVEALSWPMLRPLTERLGVTLVPIAMDDDGLVPEALAKAHRSGALSGVYVQPVIHNPLGITMSKSRRQELVRTAQRLKLPIIEDFVYGFLSDEVPIAAMSPERCITITSLSKCVAPGAAVGLIHVPEPMYARVAAAVRGGAWGVSPLALEIGARLMSSGTAQEIAMLKRVDARERQAVVRASLADCEIVADPGSYHLWLMLPDGWRSEAFAAHAARRGVAITPSSAFAMSAGHAPNAVRLALGLPQPQELEWAAAQLAALLRARPHEIDVTE